MQVQGNEVRKSVETPLTSFVWSCTIPSLLPHSTAESTWKQAVDVHRSSKWSLQTVSLAWKRDADLVRLRVVTISGNDAGI